MVFLNPLWFLLLLLLPLPWLILRRKDYVGFSSSRLLEGARRNKIKHRLALVLFSLAAVFLALGLARPQMRGEAGTQPIKSRDIIVAVDYSGSMNARFEGKVSPPEKGDSELDKDLPIKPKPPQSASGYGYYGYGYGGSGEGQEEKGNRRLDAAGAAVLSFVRARYVAHQGDRIGIMMFDEGQIWSWPLTDDLKMIYRKGLFIPDLSGGGTNFGNRKPGPIDAAVEHFDERGQAATKVLIIVTDGEESIDESTMARLVDAVKSRGIKLYVVGIGPTLARYDADIIRLAQTTGGAVFRVENNTDMQKCFQSIDEMERSTILVATQATFQDRFYIFVFIALGLFVLAALTELLFVSGD